MLETLITSKTRIKLLLKFFLNSDTKAYLRSLESEFGESSNAIRLELNRFEDAGLLVSSAAGNKKLYQANRTHPFFGELNNILFKFVGIDEIIEKVLRKIGDLHSAYITGDFARGSDSQVIDLLLVGGALNRAYVANLVEKAEKVIKRKIRLLIMTEEEAKVYITSNQALLIWEK
ncbi:ArsR family transcriptional regulator [Mucilaginibacter sp. JRF]|uniref:ArsR family transcriptional regulator n=1 Tax=Mucilaginibacter sp. JRF TaxID=2780088 RepID=UPI00187E5381|nr:ArsR family transcriptional regulator [Mucilaginibacter sp. JRF]MBE9585370.1 ArsR family transcriptional regulator [Mucilaginibacter sp. JRF]